MCSFSLSNKLTLSSLHSPFGSNYFSALFPFLLVPICYDFSWFWLNFLALILSLSKLQPSKYTLVSFIIIPALCQEQREGTSFINLSVWICANNSPKYTLWLWLVKSKRFNLVHSIYFDLSTLQSYTANYSSFLFILLTWHTVASKMDYSFLSSVKLYVYNSNMFS